MEHIRLLRLIHRLSWQQKGLFLKKVSIFQECLISDGIYPNVEEDLLGNQSCAAEDGSALQFHKHENLRLHVSSLS